MPFNRTPLEALLLRHRSFCSYKMLFHLMSRGFSFVLRARDDWVERFVGEDELPDGCFDLDVERVIIRTESLKARSRPDEPSACRQIKSTTRFDGIGRGSRDEFALAVRIVRRTAPKRDGDPNPSGDKWPDLVTNLPRWEVRARWLVRTYKKRWRQEVGFRHLKHVVGMRGPRTRDFDRAGEEVWGRLILYNVCSLGTRAERQRTHRGRKHKRAPDLTMAFKAMMRLIHGVKRVDVEAVTKRNTHVVEGGRHFERRKRNRSPPRLGYRH